MLRATPAGFEIDVHVIPRAKNTSIAGVRGDALLVRVAAPPVEGAGNDALIEFLAVVFAVPRRSVVIVSGERSRRKRVAVSGMSVEDASRRLRHAGGSS